MTCAWALSADSPWTSVPPGVRGPFFCGSEACTRWQVVAKRKNPAVLPGFRSLFGRVPPGRGATGARRRAQDAGAARAVLWDARMHELFFQFKRSYWGIQKMFRGPVHGIAPGMTPARVDLLYALVNRPWPADREQRLLPERLGVCKSVVSRMLKSLKELGWITKQKKEDDRRMWIVTVTKAGKEAFDNVYEMLVKSRATARCVFHALGGTRWKHRKQTRFDELMMLDDLAQVIRNWFRGGGSPARDHRASSARRKIGRAH